jgi:hypothetical protein
MKYVGYLLIATLFIIKLLSTLAKKQYHQHYPSQSTRNYRQYHPNPSFNPLPAQWASGPLTTYAQYTPPKYMEYNRKLAADNRYTDATASMNRELGIRRLK